MWVCEWWHKIRLIETLLSGINTFRLRWRIIRFQWIHCLTNLYRVFDFNFVFVLVSTQQIAQEQFNIYQWPTKCMCHPFYCTQIWCKQNQMLKCSMSSIVKWWHCKEAQYYRTVFRKHSRSDACPTSIPYKFNRWICTPFSLNLWSEKYAEQLIKNANSNDKMSIFRIRRITRYRSSKQNKKKNNEQTENFLRKWNVLNKICKSLYLYWKLDENKFAKMLWNRFKL